MSLRVSGGRRLRSPKGEAARPTSARVRLAVINLLARQLPGARWLDLCCGSGAMACEALQHGVAEVVAIERDRRIAAVARANLEAVAGGQSSNATTGPRVRVVCDEVLRWLGRSGGNFELIYLDPPYGAGLYAPVSELVIRQNLLTAGGTLVWECARDNIPEPGDAWQVRDKRDYGGTSVLLLQARPQDPAVTRPAAAD